MKINKMKTGILMATLVIPAFVFLFLKFFAHNNFDLPYYFPEINDNGSAKIVKGDTVFTKFKGFELTNQNNSKVSFKEIKGLKVVSFFFTRCGTICPITNRNLERVSELFKSNCNVTLLSITVDPKFDTPAVLKNYATKYKEPENWGFLTGDKTYIYKLANQDLKLSVVDAKDYDPNVKNIDEAFIHTDKVLLIDGNGFFRGIYSATDKDEIERLIVEIKVLLKK